MNLQQLENFKKQLNISSDQILREEAEMAFLDELSKNKLSAKLIFYGGTALRLAYGSPRFSEDLDLICFKPISFLEFEKFIQEVIKKSPRWRLKDIKDKRNTLFALILIKDEKLKHNFSLKIEIHKPAKKVSIETELSLIKSPSSISEPLLLVPTLNELKKLKENALVSRKKARDIFDLWYISKTLRENFILPAKTPKYSEREFRNELQVFLPKKYYPIIKQLYDKTNSKN